MGDVGSSRFRLNGSRYESFSRPGVFDVFVKLKFHVQSTLYKIFLRKSIYIYVLCKRWGNTQSPFHPHANLRPKVSIIKIEVHEGS